MSGEYLTGWEGIAWEAEERCVYCDLCSETDTRPCPFHDASPGWEGLAGGA